MAVKHTTQGDHESDAEPRLAERLRNVHVGTRNDLEVTRHLFRGEVAYVVRDPITFQSYQLDAAGYAIFVALDRYRPLRDIFDELVAQGRLARESEERFYRTIFLLHRLNFLNLPISDDKLLYQRHLAKKQARRREKIFGFLFLRIPLINPDPVLQKTVRFTRFLFTRWFFLVWAVVVAAAAFVAVRNFDHLVEPLEGVLVAGNLPLIWITLIALKILHEFGHAYACKRFGGHVPEMGVYLIVFTPLAYVDATASWGFRGKRERLIVCLAGMYVEIAIGALALFLWSATEAGFIHDLAYNVVFLATAATVLFNINPLLRYDGYYILSDLLEIPNLRSQSTRCVISVLKRIFLGVRGEPIGGGLVFRILLLSFGVATSLYRLVIVLAISAAVASKFFLAGLGIAFSYVGMILVRTLTQLTKYLWFSPETAAVRVRAIGLSVMVLVGVPLAALTVPVRTTVHTAGVLGTEREAVVRAAVDGFVRQVGLELGQSVGPGDVLVELTNDACGEAFAQASAQCEASAICYRAYQASSPVKALQEQERGAAYRVALDRRQADVANLIVRAEMTGLVVETLTDGDQGRFVRKGEPLATIVSGAWQVRAILTEDQMADCKPTVGGSVELRASANPGRTFTGIISRIEPAGSKSIRTSSLTQIGGGDVAVNPNTMQAGQPYFEITIDLPADGPSWLYHGMTCHVRCRGSSDTLGAVLLRRFLRFANKLLQG